MPDSLVTFKQAKINFLDRQSVIEAVGRARTGVLAQQGRYVQRTAQRSIRNPPRKAAKAAILRGEALAHAPAGQPPYSQTGTLKKFLLYSFDPASSTVVIGPTLLTGSSMGKAPSVLEYGGAARVPLVNRKTRQTFWKTVQLRPRPYMGPSLDRSKDRLAEIWKDKIK